MTRSNEQTWVPLLVLAKRIAFVRRPNAGLDTGPKDEE